MFWLWMKPLCAPQVSSVFQKKVQNKIKDLLQQMEEGLKTADPHDFSTYTGWTGPSAAPACATKHASLTFSLLCRHRPALPAASPGLPGGPAPAEGAGVCEEGHQDPERAQSKLPVRRRGAAGGGGGRPSQTEK